MKESEKRGFLNSNFKLFHIKGKEDQKFDYHYHDFHKIVFCLEGHVAYMVEGKTYFLNPWDLLLVRSYDIHRPVINERESYERVVIWIRPEYISGLSDSDNLNGCFDMKESRVLHLLSLPDNVRERLVRIFKNIENEERSNDIGSALLAENYMSELIVYLNRIFLGGTTEEDIGSIKYDSKIEEILSYINNNLKEEMSVDSIANSFYISKSYLMHKFRQETGYTIYSYISQKRLVGACELLSKGATAVDIAEMCGFKDYGAFLRAFKKEFGVTPKEYQTKGKDNLPDEVD